MALGMSYGSPSLESAVDELLEQGVDHIVVLPLYPQYSCSTVAAVWDELGRILPKSAPSPASLLFATTPMTWTISRAGRQRARVLSCTVSQIYCCSPIMVSRSGTPSKGIPILSAVAIPPVSWFQPWPLPDRVMMTFQSRFGREPWLTPYTDETLKCSVRKG